VRSSRRLLSECSAPEFGERNSADGLGHSGAASGADGTGSHSANACGEGRTQRPECPAPRTSTTPGRSYRAGRLGGGGSPENFLGPGPGPDGSRTVAFICRAKAAVALNLSH